MDYIRKPGEGGEQLPSSVSAVHVAHSVVGQGDQHKGAGS